MAFAITKTIGEPGIFDQSTHQDQASAMMQKYGLDPSAGAGNYAGVAQANRNAGFSGQGQAMDMYRRQAMGQGPSIAQAQLRNQSQRNMTDALALSARSRGGNISGMASQVLGANAYAQAQTNQQAAMLRAQEQQAAMQGYAGMANQLAGQGLAYDQLGTQASLGASQNALGWYSADRGMDMQAQEADRAFALGLYDRGADLAKSIAGGAGGAAGAGMMSDERAKTGVRPTTLAASQAVGDITPAAYNYKPGMGPAGTRIGPMAQDLERNPLTQSLVTEGPDGLKRVDVGGLAALATAASAEQEGRIRALEQQSRPGMLNAVPRTARRDPGVAQYAPDADIDFGSRMAASRARQVKQGFADYDFASLSPAAKAEMGMPADWNETMYYRDQRMQGPWHSKHGTEAQVMSDAGGDIASTGYGAPRTYLNATYRAGAAPPATINPFESEAVGSSGLGQLLSDKRAKNSMGSTISQQMTRNSRGSY